MCDIAVMVTDTRCLRNTTVMKIGIEAQRIFRRKKHGMDMVAMELIRHLQKTDKTNEYVIFVREDEDDKVISETANFRIERLPAAPYPIWEQIILPRAVRESGVEILHCTSNTAPLRVDVPLVVTLHDIIYLEKLNLTKGTPYQIIGNLYRRVLVPPIVKKAALILTVSESERECIRSYFSLPDEKVKTVYNGVGSHFRPITDQSVHEAMRKKYNLPEDYVFYLGNTDPKKNMEGVMRAISHLRKQGKLTFRLLMLDIDREYLRRVATRIGDLEILNHIYFCGYIRNEELPAIYSMAKIFLYPSLRESFGIPILEAMACGVPVITSSTYSMPEVAGDAALLVNPSDPVDIAAKIIQLLEDKALGENLVKKGLERYKDFSWERNALQTVDLYKTIQTGIPVVSS